MQGRRGRRLDHGRARGSYLSIASSSRAVARDVATRATGSQIDSQRQSDAGGSSQPHAQSAARDMDANDYYLMDLNGFLHVK